MNNQSDFPFSQELPKMNNQSIILFSGELTKLDIVVLIIVLAISTMFVIVQTQEHLTSLKQKVFSSGTKPSVPKKSLIISRLKLAKLSYCSSSLTDSEENPLEVQKGNPFPDAITIQKVPFKVISTRMEDSIWLLQRNKQNCDVQPKWFLLVRGTKTVADVISDMKLTLAVAHDSHVEFFNRVVDVYKDNALRILKENGATKYDSIELVGHSLGGCICEALMMVLKEDFASLKAFVIDTPGTPLSFRCKNHDSNDQSKPLQGLSTLNSVNNIVNTLTRPLASELYVCGEGSSVPLSKLWGVISDGLFNLSLAGFANYAITSHKLEEIEKYVENGDVRKAEAFMWPQYSGWLAKKLYKFYDNIKSFIVNNHYPGDSVIRSRAQSAPKVFNRRLSFAEIRSDHEEIPKNLSSMKDGTPYVVPDINQFITSVDPEKHMIIPLVGMTSVGKSSFLKAILGMEPDDPTIKVGHKVNVTTLPTIVRFPIEPGQKAWSGGPENGAQLFVMDMPGVNGQETADAQTQFMTEHIKQQLVLMEQVVQVCCIVMGDALNDFNVHMFKDVHEILKTRTMVVRNLMACAAHQEIEDSRIEAEQKLKAHVDWDESIRGLVIKDVRLCRAPGYKVTGEEGVCEAKHALLEFASKTFDENAKEVQKARIQRKSEEVPASKTIVADGAIRGCAGACIKPLYETSMDKVFMENSYKWVKAAPAAVRSISESFAVDSTVAAVDNTISGTVAGAAAANANWVKEPITKVITKQVTTITVASSAVGGFASGALGLPIGVAIDCARCAVGKGPPDMKKQVRTRCKNAPNQIVASTVGASVGTLVCPGIGTQVGMFCGSFISSIFFDAPTE